MSETTGIEWATHTASPWFGCSKVSAGCTNCYAEALTLQRKWARWGENSPRVRSKGFWKDAYRLNRKAGEAQAFLEGQDRPRMFTSLMDWLDPKAPLEWFTEFLQVVIECQNLDWLLLTKRPELWRERIHKAVTTARAPLINFKAYRAMLEWFNGTPPENVWFGVTVENQEMAYERIPVLLDIPARIRWLSVEPLLEPVRFRTPTDFMDLNGNLGVHWVVVGGESGGKRRDCGVEAIENVVEQCRKEGVPVFVKQDCAFKPGQQGRIPDDVWRLKQFPKTTVCGA